MSRKTIFILVLFFLLTAWSCLTIEAKKEKQITKALYPKEVNAIVFADAGNPLTKEKIEFGRYLFYDRRISYNQTKSCASCHDPKFSFTDGYRRSIGIFGDVLQRNSIPLINIITRKYLTASDSSLHYPLQQIQSPLFHDKPVELGWGGHEQEILQRLSRDSVYQTYFSRGKETLTPEKKIQYLKKCLSCFVSSIVSYGSKFDRYQYFKTATLTESEQRGMTLFFSDALQCKSCHSGFNFATPLIRDKAGAPEFYFNTGLYNLDGKGAYPAYDMGLTEQTGNSEDMGKYRVPTLRNLAFTAPYYHDGSAATLEEVLLNYERGGRTTQSGDYMGDGKTSPLKSKLIKGFSLTSQERKDLISFLLCLSDSSVLTNKNYSNPFLEDETAK